jgi:CheY-like chemotaxis protein
MIPKTENDVPDRPCLGTHRRVILVADDEVMIRNLVTLLLQTQGYFVLTASDGQEPPLGAHPQEHRHARVARPPMVSKFVDAPPITALLTQSLPLRGWWLRG